LPSNRHDWDIDSLRQQVERIFPMPENFDWQEVEQQTDREELVDHLMELAESADDHKKRELGPALMGKHERVGMLNVMDRLWIQHLTSMDDVREGIGLRAYGQRDPLIEYKVEAARMFGELQATIRSEVVFTIYHLQIQQQAPPPPPTRQAVESGPVKGEDGAARAVGAARPARRGRARAGQ